MPRESTGERVGAASERVGLQPLHFAARSRATLRRRVGAAVLLILHYYKYMLAKLAG